jgi:hypothetical protein
MIPAFDHRGLLPPGIHAVAGWDEVVRHFGFTAHREMLLAKARQFMRSELAAVGAGLELCVGGGFVTDKPAPRDIDCTIALPLSQLASRIELLRLSVDADRIWAQYGVDLFPTIEESDAMDYRDYYQFVGPTTGVLKGLDPSDRQGLIRVLQWQLG